MFAIFYLLEPDIFPVKDLGLIRAINNLYSKNKPLSAEEIIALSEKYLVLINKKLQTFLLSNFLFL